ncbi:MAG: cation diffusion facilitator family transporter [Candidatus Falkowbacteria bacterium]
MSENYKIKGFLPVLAALIGNIFIAIIKFVAFMFSGSMVLFSEAVHSVADSFNQLLLLVGIKRSVKGPDKNFIYGYGRERFFWALISACGIFFIGAGAIIYNGVDSLLHKREILDHPIVYVVLGLSFMIESITFLIAIRELKRQHPGEKLIRLVKNGDPSTLAVVYEDGLAVIGVSIAFLAIILSNVTGQYYWDAIGSIIIGILLAVIAVILIAKNRQFLLGKAIPLDLQDKIIRLLESDPAIDSVVDFKSTVLDIGIYRIKCIIEFNGSALLAEVFRNTSLQDQYDEVKDDFEEFKKFCMNYADRVPRLVGKKIDEIETRIRTENQGVKYIDIEVN